MDAHAHLFNGEAEEGPGTLVARLGEHVQVETALENEHELALSQLAQLKTKVLFVAIGHAKNIL